MQLFEQRLEVNFPDILEVIIANGKEQYLMISNLPPYKKNLRLHKAPLYLWIGND